MLHMLFARDSNLWFPGNPGAPYSQAGSPLTVLNPRLGVAAWRGSLSE